MTDFEKNYTKYIQPLYGKDRDVMKDDVFLKEKVDHKFYIKREDRVDFTKYPIYNIDPENCNDVDDAFSIYKKKEKIYLAIHIADPTNYISLESKLWQDIIERVTTKYPSNRKPLSLLPPFLIQKCSLCKNEMKNDEKDAISVIIEIDTKTLEPIGTPELLFTIVRVDKNNNYSYKEAAKCKEKFEIGLKISANMKKNRAKYSKAIQLSEFSPLRFSFHDDMIEIYNDTEDEKLMKEMIAEFAIYTNGFIGNYLKEHLQFGIYRSCDSKNLMNDITESKTASEVLQQIISQGIVANYNCNGEKHDLVGLPLYSHFTSPIRRMSDMICHYLLKYIHLKNTAPPFDRQELKELTEKCLEETRKDKKIQFTDVKFRLLQALDYLIKKRNKVHLEFYITSYTGLFLNIIISKFDEYDVHLSYTLRIPKSNKPYSIGEKMFLSVSKVNCFTEFDNGTIPELDDYLL